MELIELLKKSRSYRRFDENYKIEKETLTELIESSRFAPSTVNSQAIRYILVNTAQENAKIFDTLSFAGLLKGAGTPKEGERPTAYIIMLCDKTVGTDKRFDDGIMAQTIMLSACEKGLGGCILGAINKEKLMESFGIDCGRYSIELVLALGKPKETVILTDIEEGDSTAYYRDSEGRHYVPKRKTKELILDIYSE